MSLIDLNNNSLLETSALYKKKFWYIFFASITFALFGITLSYGKVGLYLIYCVALCLLVLLVFRKVHLVYYILLLVVFNMSEYSKYISQEAFYTFRTVGIFGVSLAAIFLIVLVAYKLLFAKDRFKPLEHPVFRWSLFMFFMALCIGVVYLFFGNTTSSGFKSDMWYFIIFLGAFYFAYGFPDLEIVGKILLVSILISPFIILLGWLFLPKGNYGGAPISSYNPLYFATPLIPSFLFLYRKDDKEEMPFWLIVTSSICSIITIFLQPSGKTLIFLPTSMILAWLLLLKRRMKKFILVGITIILIVLIFAPIYPNFVANYGNVLLKSKFYQVASLFEGIVKILNNPEAVYSIAPSPMIRMLEFMNTFHTLKELPIGLLVGSGIGGSFSDRYYQIPYYPLFAFSEDQWLTRKFYRVHESFNFVFLEFGILGIFFLLLFIVWLLKKAYDETSGNLIFLYIMLIFCVSFMLGYSLQLAIFTGTLMGILMSKKTTLHGDGGAN